MHHQPAAAAVKDHAIPYKMRLGLWMFLSYALFYAGFVAINLIAPLLMEKSIILGLNLATVYGFALIIVALVQALIYDALCHRKEVQLSNIQVNKEEES